MQTTTHWKTHLGNRLLVQFEDQVIEVVPIDATEDGKFVRFTLTGGSQVWKGAEQYQFLQALEVGAFDRMQHAVKVAEALCAQQQQRISELEAQLVAFDGELQAERARSAPIEENTRRVVEKINAEHEREREAHGRTREAIVAARRELDEERSAHQQTRAERDEQKAEVARVGEELKAAKTRLEATPATAQRPAAQNGPKRP